jgi:hypothetical protein
MGKITIEVHGCYRQAVATEYREVAKYDFGCAIIAQRGLKRTKAFEPRGSLTAIFITRRVQRRRPLGHDYSAVGRDYAALGPDVPATVGLYSQPADRALDA